jgi:hypothetical protein
MKLSAMLELRSPSLGRMGSPSALALIFLAACGSKDTLVASSTPAAPASAAPAPATASLQDVSGVAELKDLRIFPEKPAKGHHFVAEISVASGAAVKDPMFRVVFKDTDGSTLDSGSCAYRGIIKAGDRAPCYGAFWKAAKWAKYDVTYVPGDAKPENPAPLTVSGATLVGGNEVDGQITNTGSTAIKNVNAYVSLYGADGKIVAGDSGPVAGNDLAPGASSKFAIKIEDLAAPAKTFAVKASP